jgi:hypothetical protein
MKIFISYRRDDSSGHAGRLFDHLTDHFGSEHVFMDVDTIRPGEDFRRAIEKAVGSCEVVLVMVGRQWLTITDAQGRRRLEDPADFVRAEVASALANPTVRVIPVLIQGARMPGASDLPDSLQDLAYRNAAELRDNSFQLDADRLIKDIERSGEKPARKGTKPPSQKPGPVLYGSVFLGIAVIALLFWAVKFGGLGGGSTPTEAPTFIATVLPTGVQTEAPTVVQPTAEPSTPAPTLDPISPPVRTVDQYFKYINNAAIQDDLQRAWDLLTEKLQCNKSDQCQFSTYSKFWWQVQVQYTLYDCGSNTVAAELIYYGRDKTPRPNTKPTFLSYEVLEQNGQLKLNSATTISGISAYCTPAPVIE